MMRDRSTTGGVKPLLDNARWAFRAAWTARPRLVVGLGGVTVVRGLIPASIALVMREIIDTGVEHSNDATTSITPFLIWLVLGLLLTVTEAVSRFLERFLMLRLLDDVDIRVTAEILEHAARLDVAFFEDPQSQDMIQRAQSSPANHITSFLSDVLTFITHLVQAISLGVVIVAIEPLVLFLLVPFAAAHFFFQWRMSRRQYMDERNRTSRRRWSRYFMTLLTSRESVPEVKLLRIAPILVDRFRSITVGFRDQNRSRYLRSLVGGSLFAFLTTTAFYAMFARVVMRMLEGVITVGDLTAFGMAGLRLRAALESVATSVSNAMGRTLYVSNLREFLEAEPVISGGMGVVPTESRGALGFRNVSFTYPGAGEPTLHGINLAIEPGETVAVVGENGAGKSTLVKLLARFYDPDVGSVVYDGSDVRSLAIDFLHRQIAFVFQEFGRYEASLNENIAYGDWEPLLDDPQAVQQVIREAGIEDLVNSLPEKGDTILGRRFGSHDLSKGQWQQVAIARAFARNARVLILDEPTSSLDARAEYELFLRSRELARGRTTLLVSHRFSTVRMADRIVVLHDGRIIEEGSHDSLLASGGHYAKLYDLQQLQIGDSPRANPGGRTG